MEYFDERKNVDQYIEMTDGYDGRELIDHLTAHLPAGATILELGMGPGRDLDILAERYSVTGSDASSIFIDLYREKQSDADILKLDAVTVDTDRTFDCIYSNKVLHHLTKADLQRSFIRQYDVLNDGGVLFHSFWFGDKEEIYEGLRFVYYTEKSLKDVIGTGFELLAMERYKEDEDGDSFYVVLRKLSNG